MKWKDDLKHILIGVPMLWLFIIILGFILKLMENFYFIWLIGIFIVAPLVLYVAPKLYDEYKKRKGRSM